MLFNGLSKLVSMQKDNYQTFPEIITLARLSLRECPNYVKDNYYVHYKIITL